MNKSEKYNGKINFVYEVYKVKNGVNIYVETKEFLSPQESVLYTSIKGELVKMEASKILNIIREGYEVDLKGYECVNDGFFTFHRIVECHLEQEDQQTYSFMEFHYEASREYASDILVDHLKFILNNNEEISKIIWNSKKSNVIFYNKVGEIQTSVQTENLNGMDDLRKFLFNYGSNLNVLGYGDEEKTFERNV